MSDDEAPPTRPDRSCPLCGWLGSGRNGKGICIDQAPCAHRRLLEIKGRPRSSACACIIWPCPCLCHGGPHGPTLGNPA